jgi:signal transduction histidine kinase
VFLRFDDHTVTQLYPVAQAAISQASKRGHAPAVSVRRPATDGQAELLVSDDGAAFDPRRVNSGGPGLKIMQFRAQMAGGYLSVESAPGEGTNLRRRCPVRPELSLT